MRILACLLNIACLIIFALFLGSPVHASNSCKAINLYENSNTPLLQIPIQDQGEVNTCYANAASQLIDYDRLEGHSNLTEMSSPLWIALIHKETIAITWSPDSLEYSRLAWVFKGLEKYGICKESVVHRSIERLKHGNADLRDADLIEFIDTLWDEYQSRRKKIRIFETKKQRENAYKTAYEVTLLNSDFIGKIQYSLFDEFHWIVDYSKGDRLNSLLNHVFSECSGDNLIHSQFPNRKSAALGFASNEKIRNILNDVLIQNKPIGVGYCYSILDEGTGYRGLPFMPRAIAMAIHNGDCGAHYSLVVGQRPNTKSGCEYLIRNSLGTDFWTDQWTCQCKNSNDPLGRLFDCKSGEPHSAGVEVIGCWIDAEDMTSNIFDLTHFK